MADYIDTFYNRTRRHSHLGGLSPEQSKRLTNRTGVLSTKSWELHHSAIDSDPTLGRKRTGRPTQRASGRYERPALPRVAARGSSAPRQCRRRCRESHAASPGKLTLRGPTQGPEYVIRQPVHAQRPPVTARRAYERDDGSAADCDFGARHLAMRTRERKRLRYVFHRGLLHGTSSVKSVVNEHFKELGAANPISTSLRTNTVVRPKNYCALQVFLTVSVKGCRLVTASTR